MNGSLYYPPKGVNVVQCLSTNVTVKAVQPWTYKGSYYADQRELRGLVRVIIGKNQPHVLGEDSYTHSGTSAILSSK